jgi:hypothetical protein
MGRRSLDSEQVSNLDRRQAADETFPMNEAFFLGNRDPTYIRLAIPCGIRTVIFFAKTAMNTCLASFCI